MRKVFGYEVKMEIDLLKLFIIFLCIILIVMLWLNYQELMADPNKVCKDYCEQVCPCWPEDNIDYFNVSGKNLSVLNDFS